MAKKADVTPSDELEDPLVVWERAMKRRREIDAAVIDLILEFQGPVAQRDFAEGLTVAIRAELRIQNAPLPSNEFTRDLRKWIADVVKLATATLETLRTGAENRSQFAEHRKRLAKANENGRLYTSDEKIYRFDREAERNFGHKKDLAHAVLESVRVETRFRETIAHVIDGQPREFARTVASILAHCIEVAELSSGRADRERVEGAIRSDLRALRQKDNLPPLWPTSPPAWFTNEHDANKLSKQHAYGIDSTMHPKHVPPPEDDPLNELSVPKRHAATPKDKPFPNNATPTLKVDFAEERFAEVQKLQFAGIQALLSSLRGTTLGNYEDNRALAHRVMRMVNDSGGVLLLNGEFVDGRGRTKIFTSQPVSIHCETKGSPTFHLRTPDGRGYVTALPTWPGLYIISKNSLANP